MRNSHKGATQPPSLVAGVRWIDDSTSIWSDKLYDGGGMLTASRVDPTSDLIMPVELRRRNLIWNGSMDCWQDGTSEAGITANNVRCADGWRFECVTHGTWTVARSTTVPTVAQAGRNINFSHQFSCTTADTSVAAGALVCPTFTIEGYDYQELYQQPQHLSFWARSTLVGTYGLSVRNSADDRTFVFTFTINGANTYELKEFVLRDIPSGGTWDFVEGAGLKVAICLAGGTTFHTTANAWQTGNFRTTSAQANLAALNTHTFNIADVRLHGGTVRSPVIVRSFPEILREAERRFIKTFPYATKPAQASATFLSSIGLILETAASVDETTWHYHSRLRATPTVTTFNPTQSNANWRSDVDSADTAVTVSAVGDSSAVLRAASGVNIAVRIHATADARFT